MTILLLLVAIPLLVYWLWPKPTLIYRRGSVYQRNFEEFFTIQWSCKIVKWSTSYVKYFDGIYAVDCSNVSLAELRRQTPPSEEQRLQRLLNQDLEGFRVIAVNEDRIIIKTPVGAKFDVELEDTGWHFRHSQKTHSLLTDRLPWALSHYRSSRSAQIES
jgi:hypothetical protein